MYCIAKCAQDWKCHVRGCRVRRGSGSKPYLECSQKMNELGDSVCDDKERLVSELRLVGSF